MTKPRCNIALLAVALVLPVVANAADPVKKVRPASLVFTEVCEQYEMYAAARDDVPGGGVDEIAGASLGSAILGPAAALAGDVLSAGITAVGAALEEASRAQAFSIEGRTVYPFYAVRFSGGDTPQMDMEPREGCLKLMLRAPPDPDEDGLRPSGSGDGVDLSGASEDEEEPAPATEGDDAIARLEAEEAAGTMEPNLGSLLLDVEIRVHAGPEAVFLEPVYVRYEAPVSGLSATKRLPAELHVTFSTAAVNGVAENGSAFAVARIQLPPLKVGDRWFSDHIGTTSGVLNLRPREGAAASLQTEVGTKLTEHATKVRELRALRAQLAYSHGDESQPTEARSSVVPTSVTEEETTVEIERSSAPPFLLAPLTARERATPEFVKKLIADIATAEMDLVHRRTVLNDLASRLRITGDEDILVGATSVDVRLALVKSENRFGTAVAAALRARAPAVGTALTGHLTRPAKARWTVADGLYYSAIAAVRSAETELASAQSSGDAVAVEAAKSKLLAARIDVNVRAVTIDLPPPYPDPLA